MTCEEKNLALALAGRDPTVKYAITCSCGFRSKEYDDSLLMEEEFNQYVVEDT